MPSDIREHERPGDQYGRTTPDGEDEDDEGDDGDLE